MTKYLSLLLIGLSFGSSVVAAEKPNIVMIMADDVGLGDVSFHARNVQHKEPFVETPTIDALAAQGLWFTDGQAQDSNNLLPLFTGTGEFQQREYFINQAGAHQELMMRKMPWKLIIQSDFKRTKFDPLALYNLKDDPHEDTNLVKNTEFKEIVDGLFHDYLDIVESKRPTAPGRSIANAR